MLSRFFASDGVCFKIHTCEPCEADNQAQQFTEFTIQNIISVRL